MRKWSMWLKKERNYVVMYGLLSNTPKCRYISFMYSLICINLTATMTAMQSSNKFKTALSINHNSSSMKTHDLSTLKVMVITIYIPNFTICTLFMLWNLEMSRSVVDIDIDSLQMSLKHLILVVGWISVWPSAEPSH